MSKKEHLLVSFGKRGRLAVFWLLRVLISHSYFRQTHRVALVSVLARLSHGLVCLLSDSVWVVYVQLGTF